MVESTNIANDENAIAFSADPIDFVVDPAQNSGSLRVEPQEKSTF